MYLLSSDFRAIASSFCWLDCLCHLLFNCPYCRKFLFKLPSIIIHPDFIVILVAELCGKQISEKSGGLVSEYPQHALIQAIRSSHCGYQILTVSDLGQRVSTWHFVMQKPDAEAIEAIEHIGHEAARLLLLARFFVAWRVWTSLQDRQIPRSR